MELTSYFPSIAVLTQELVGQLSDRVAGGHLYRDDLVDLPVSDGG